jgi:DNA-binding NarL/FixJ family response regulator
MEFIPPTGYEVVAVTTGKGALEKLRHEPVELIVLDLQLPDGSGLEYLQQFMDVNRDVKVVINTRSPLYKWDFRSWAAKAYLIISSDSSELKNTIDGVLQSNE